MDSRLDHVPRVLLIAAFMLSASLAHAIPKAAEDENGTVSIAPDVARPKASAKTAKPVAKQPAPPRMTAKTAKQATKGGKSPSLKSSAKPNHQKPAHGKK